MLQYISNLQETLKSLRSLCGVDNTVHNYGPKKDTGFEIKEGALTMDMVSEGEEWFIVHGALQIIIVANCLTSRALEFEASLRTTLARIGTSLLLSSFGSTLDNPRVAATYDNGEVPLAGRASLDVATHMAYGSDPVDPHKAFAPGLVYDTCSQNFFEHLIHWFPIFNCLVMVIFLTGLVSIILMRTLRNEYARYGREDDDLESLEGDVTEELGWKLVHGDVFQPPRNLVLLFVLVGTGAQVTLLIFIMILLAIIRNTYGLLNYLQALVEKSQITQILEGEKEGSEVLTQTDGYDYDGGNNVLKMLVYYSMTGLLRVHCPLWNYHTGLKCVAPIDINQQGVYTTVTGSNIFTIYHYGFANLMLQRYAEGIRELNNGDSGLQFGRKILGLLSVDRLVDLLHTIVVKHADDSPHNQHNAKASHPWQAVLVSFLLAARSKQHSHSPASSS